MNIEYKRNCPLCGNEIVYSTKKYFDNCIKVNRCCYKCKKNGAKFGSENHFFGKTHFIETRRRLSDAGIGQPRTLGIKHSDESKRKMRISMLERLEKKGIPPSVDVGAPEYFQYQNESGYSFIEDFKLKDIGYVVDGYDAIQHIVCEFDPPHHFNRPSKQKKDLIRQTNIIDYFNSIGKPLKHFIRARADKNGKVLSQTTVF